MHTRRSKKVESKEIEHLSFVEVKVEPNDFSELMQTENDGQCSEAVNKPVTTMPPKKIKTNENRTYKKWTRSTQVTEDDIDMLKVKRPNNHDENTLIKPNGTESIIPQCRFCLRRVSRENLKIIVRKQSVKALAAFQIRVFINDAYPFACSNCLNMIDIILDYKSTVIKARNLLLDKRMHMESNGWDDLVNIESFNQCKLAVEQHRMQIDAIYDDHMTQEERSNTHILEPKMELNIGKEDVTRDEINQTQSTAVPTTSREESTVEFLLEAGFEIMDNILKSNVADGSVDSGHAINTDETFELSSEKMAHEGNNDSPINAEGVEPVNKRKAKEKKVDYSSESAQNKGNDDYNPVELSESDDDDLDYIPEQGKSESEHEMVSELSSSKKKRYRKDRKKPRQPRAKKNGKGPKNPSKPKEPQKVQPVLCDLCGESVYPETIEGHRNRHLGIKPYKCPMDGCDWSFFGRSNMCTHIRRVHQKDRVHECDICGKLIRGQLGFLNQHKKRHFLKERNHVCPICGKGFTLNRYLKQHSAIHTGLFPYECSYCGKKFNNKWSMKTHEKNMHEKKNQVSTSYDSEINTEVPNQLYTE